MTPPSSWAGYRVHDNEPRNAFIAFNCRAVDNAEGVTQGVKKPRNTRKKKLEQLYFLLPKTIRNIKQSFVFCGKIISPNVIKLKSQNRHECFPFCRFEHIENSQQEGFGFVSAFLLEPSGAFSFYMEFSARISRQMAQCNFFSLHKRNRKQLFRESLVTRKRSDRRWKCSFLSFLFMSLGES